LNSRERTAAKQWSFFVGVEVEITLFRGARDTAPDNIAVTWADLCTFAEESTVIERKRSHKLDHEALIFGRCEGRRSNANVRFLSGLAADFDTAPDQPRYVAFDGMCDQLEAEGFAFIAYTTTKNCRQHNKFRLLMPYARDVPVGSAKQAWQACNASFGGAIDGSTKDPARLSFLPATWTENPFHDGKGVTTLAEPFNAVRVNVEGKPVLTFNQIDALDLTIDVQRSAPPKNISPCSLSAIEHRRLAHGKGTEDAAWALLANLDHSPLVKPWMLEQLPLEEGNRDFRFMVAVANQAIRSNLPINAETIEVLAEQFSRRRLSRAPAFDAARQAENALAWALHHSVGASPTAEPRQPEC
jgi:hypothetical protein